MEGGCGIINNTIPSLIPFVNISRNNTYLSAGNIYSVFNWIFFRKQYSWNHTPPHISILMLFYVTWNQHILLSNKEVNQINKAWYYLFSLFVVSMQIGPLLVLNCWNIIKWTAPQKTGIVPNLYIYTVQLIFNQFKYNTPAWKNIEINIFYMCNIRYNCKYMIHLKFTKDTFM